MLSSWWQLVDAEGDEGLKVKLRVLGKGHNT